ncbi:MAG: DUF218 domain-containing protein [Proteobacteria bacterium]|nr:DUF218 domain-containing protein [Pseudomonadota bacterium]
MGDTTVSVLKNVQYLATPIGMLVLIALLVLISKLLGWRKISNSLIAVLILVFWVFATPISALWIENQFIHSLYPDGFETSGDNPYDAIVVAGWQKAFTPNDPLIDQFWSERLWVAAQEHQKSEKPIIIISSEFPVLETPEPGEKTFAVNKLEQWGVAPEKIVNAQPGRTTYEAMTYAQNELLRLDAKNVLLVGYAYRVARKKQTLEALFREGEHSARRTVYLRTTEQELIYNKLDYTRIDMWLPNEKTFARSSFITHEIAGHIAYRLGGWIAGN